MRTFSCASKYPAENLLDLFKDVEDFAERQGYDINISKLISEPKDSNLISLEDKNVLVTTEISSPLPVSPEISGRVAVLNCISDIYVSGGNPKNLLLNLVVSYDQDYDTLIEILFGIFSECIDHEIEVVGGHTTYGNETLIGLIALGNKQRVISKCTNNIGDVLFMCKKIGVNIGVNKLLERKMSADDIEELESGLLISNREIVKSIEEIEISAMTDISGFGFICHLSEMINGNGANIYIDKIPVFSFVERESTYRNSNIRNNINYAKRRQDYLDNNLPSFLFDPQTNGPVLVATNPLNAGIMNTLGFSCVGIIVEGRSIQVS